MNYGRLLFHNKQDFERETFHKRMELYGFKNIGRMELFLWDLELFLQIQSILGDRIVLKGGAATQFYLPMEVQRTSVDIDMVFCGTEEEINNTLNRITERLGTDEDLFIFTKHIPKKPKTNLPLNTYHVEIPSVLTSRERNSEENDPVKQELKIEFIMEPEKRIFTKKTGEKIFAVNSTWEYQILPISYLFADKLTTIGSETIGVQNDRMDEQVKQFYDVMMLTKHCINELDTATVRSMYVRYAEKEWHDRKTDPYDLNEIIADVRRQLYRYSMADSGDDTEIKKYINDFYALYLNSKVEFTPQTVACGAALVHLLYDLMISGRDWNKIEKALELERMLELNQFEGKEKGMKTRQIRELLVQEFGSYSPIPTKILKGKSLKRIFWAIVDVDNINEIEKSLAGFCMRMGL